MTLCPHTFLNPDFEAPETNVEYCRKHRASGLGYDVLAMIDTARFALENDGSGVPLDRRGIATTLQIASRIAGDLIDACETLEKRDSSAPAK